MREEIVPTVLRRLLVVAGIALLIVAGWGGLVMVGWRWPRLGDGSVVFHGPLMVGAFLGTLLSLERAVALRRRWAYAAPAAAVMSGLALLVGLPVAGEVLQVVAGLVLIAVFFAIIRRRPSAFTIAMAVGALSWVAATILWAAGKSMAMVVPWWVGFLVLTIFSERLELSRFLSRRAGKDSAFFCAAGLYFLGLVLTLRFPGLGWAVSGMGMLAMAAWLAVYDLAMRTVLDRGLTRYIAACLLSGYFWLFVGGGLILVTVFARVGPYPIGAAPIESFVTKGPLYDAILHSVLVGFVFSMIFGHAAIIFPSVLAVRMNYRRRFYVHLFLLEFCVALRVVADVAAIQLVRQWAGLLNGVAIVLFLAQTIGSVRSPARRRRKPHATTRKIALSMAPRPFKKIDN